MPKLRLRHPGLSLATVCAGALLLEVLVGALVFFGHFLASPRTILAEAPAPSAIVSVTRLSSIIDFRVAGHEAACVASVTVPPDSQIVDFDIYQVNPSKAGGPPMVLTLDGAGYHTSVRLDAGWPGGLARLPMTPPKRAVIATACFPDLGRARIALAGTAEDRTMGRPSVIVAGRPTPGGIAITFQESARNSYLYDLGAIMRHASNLTGGLLPVSLVWAIALLTLFGVPLAFVGVLWSALARPAVVTPPGA